MPQGPAARLIPLLKRLESRARSVRAVSDYHLMDTLIIRSRKSLTELYGKEIGGEIWDRPALASTGFRGRLGDTISLTESRRTLRF